MAEDFPGGPVVKTSLSNAGVQVQFLVGELRSHIPCSPRKQNIKKKTHQKSYCNKFNEDFITYGPREKKVMVTDVL